MGKESSSAIQPGKQSNSGGEAIYKSIGNVLDFEAKDKIYSFICEDGQVAIKFYTHHIVRIVMNPKEQPVLDQSQTVETKPEQVEVTEEISSEQVILRTDSLAVKIRKQPIRIQIIDMEENVIVDEGERGMAHENGEVIAFHQMNEDDHFYGFGEKTGYLDKRGEKYEMWNTDVFSPHNPEIDPLYQSIPYFMKLNNGKAHGVFFDNTFKTTFDMKSESNYYSFKAEGGQLDYYVLAGPSPKSVLEQYTFITGRMPLPPKWALGYHQSRYSYESEEEVREVADKFIQRDIPVDVINLDIHYMDGYRVFTFDQERFPNPEKLISDLANLGIRIVPIVDPGVKKDPEYDVYKEGINKDYFCKYIEGDIYFGDVWPGPSAFPDFTNKEVQKWWGDQHSYYTDLGISGIWNDMNEPAVFNDTMTMDVEVMHDNDGNPTTHRELHNVYGFLMGKATYEGLKKQLEGKRPFILTRAGYAGVQRYAAVWTGDNRSFWEHLQMALPMVMNLGLSGIPLAGPDVGGFAHDTNGELLTRWTQVGAFTPYFRNHSVLGSAYQEPWQFGEKYESIIKEYIQLRYKWMPQLYSLFYEASRAGLPVMRPLVMEYPEDPKTYNLNDQFMVGDNVIIAPILQPSVTDRSVYLPEGNWVEYTNGTVYEGGQAHLVHAELDEMPIFIKQGTAIMQGEWVSNKEKTPKSMNMNVYVGQSDDQYNLTFYDDDGETFDYQEGKHLKMNLKINSSKQAISISVDDVIGNYNPQYENINVKLIGLEEGQDVIINGEVSSGQQHKLTIYK